MGVRLRLIIGLIIFVVIYLVRTTNMGIWGGPVPNWEGVRMLPGSIGVLRVACPWVRCRAPPGWLRNFERWVPTFGKPASRINMFHLIFHAPALAILH